MREDLAAPIRLTRRAVSARSECGPALAQRGPMVVIASEPMDEDPGWTEVGVGELLHVGPDLHIDRETIVAAPPAKQMVLSGRAVRSQAQEHT